MKLSTRSRYALRILVQIALDNLNGNSLSQGRKIAEKQGISEPYLEQIMIPLKKGELVGTSRGCNGGYELKKPSNQITVLTVIELMEGPVKLSDCSRKQKHCQRVKNCPTASIWGDLEKAFREKASSITIQDIIDRYRQSAAPDYII